MQVVVRLARLLAATALAVTAVALPAPALAATVPAAGAVAVPSSGEPVATSFRTKSDSVYRITVSGAYSYNGREHLADCGWWNPEAAGTTWHPGGFFQVDGAAARCASMPYAATHTYAWEQRGTGAPFTFRVTDAMPFDNIGHLAVQVVEVESAMSVYATCDVASVDNRKDVLVTAAVIVVRASASGGPIPGNARARCRVVGPSGTVATVDTAGTGPEVAGADAVLLPQGDYQVCVSSQAEWIVYTWETVYGDDYCKPLAG